MPSSYRSQKHDKDVLIVSKGLSFKSGCTTLAEGGYNAAFAYVDAEDSIQAHLDDTLKGGATLTIQNWHVYWLKKHLTD